MHKHEKYYVKNIGLSASDNEKEISAFEIKELMLFREDAKSNAGYADAMTAAEEFLEFLDIVYYKILDADFVAERDDDLVWLRVKILQKVGIKKGGVGDQIDNDRSSDGGES